MTCDDRVSRRNIHLPEDQMEWLRREARRRRISVSALLRWMIEEAREGQRSRPNLHITDVRPTYRAEEARGAERDSYRG